MRGKPSGEPFIPTYTYDPADMLAALELAAFRSTHVAFERHAGLDYALAFAQKPERRAPSSRTRTGSLRRRDVAAGPEVADAEIDAFNRAADAYFTSLADWDHHLAKPFSQTAETPTLLMSVAVLLQGLRLTRGMTVLEFGAGSGWLSRYLTQMGCRVILLDVSPAALRIARELYVRQPVIGDQPPPAFLDFDGRHIALPDASVDRVICFDAFHHAPNPHSVIREFARVLAPGGIAGFTEPGPRHAEAPRSQFESHTYGVVELDVDVHDVWRTAKGCGFRDLRMCVFHALPYHVSLEEYENLVAGGEAQEDWLASTRKFLRHVRSFFLVKDGVERVDSRTPTGLACEIRATLATATPTAGQPVVIDAIVANTGAATWLASNVSPGGVALGTHLYDAGGALVTFDLHCEALTDPPRDVAPGDTVRCRVTVPPMRAGQYRVELDCVAAQVTWFAQAGSPTTVVTIDVASAAGG
jgi:SAM-dependent methyltransferase